MSKSSLEGLSIMRKQHLGGNKMLKKLFEQKKMRSKLCYRTDLHLFAGAKSVNFGSKD